MTDTEIKDNTGIIDVKALRNRLGYTQEQLAVKIGVTSLTIRRWEKGVTRPNQMARNVLKEIETR